MIYAVVSSLWDQETWRSGVLHSQGCTFSMKIGLTDMQPSPAEKKNNVFGKCTVSTAYHYKAKVILKNFANLWTWAQLLFPTVLLFTPLFGDIWSFQWKIRDWMKQWCILIFLYQWESYLTASHMFPVLLLFMHNTLISHEQSPHLPVHWLVVERWRGVVVVGGGDCVFECPWIYRGQGRRLVLESCW